PPAPEPAPAPQPTPSKEDADQVPATTTPPRTPPATTPPPPPPHPPPPPPPGPGDNATAELNHWRATAGVGAVSLSVAASHGAQLHANFLQHHKLDAYTAHSEKPGQTGYTPEGDAAANRSVVTGWPAGATGPAAVRGL